MERSVARRLVTFYSWQRLALGRVAELAIERPGMVTLPSKYQYEQAQAAGFEPDGRKAHIFRSGLDESNRQQRQN